MATGDPGPGEAGGELPYLVDYVDVRLLSDKLPSKRGLRNVRRRGFVLSRVINEKS